MKKPTADQVAEHAQKFPTSTGGGLWLAVDEDEDFGKTPQHIRLRVNKTTKVVEIQNGYTFWQDFYACKWADRAVYTALDCDGLPVRPELLYVHDIADYHEDFGTVLLWRLPIDEPPHVSSPNSSDYRLMCEGGRYCRSHAEMLERDDLDLLDEDAAGNYVPWATHFSFLPLALVANPTVVKP